MKTPKIKPAKLEDINSYSQRKREKTAIMNFMRNIL